MLRPVPLAVLVRVAGTRWTVEERFQTGNGLCGLEHQLRRWRSWYRWVTLVMLAHAFLVVAAMTERSCRPPPSGLIPLTCNEVQHLFAAMVARPAGDLGHRLRWSVWRRRQQVRAPHLPLPTPDRRLATRKITISGRTHGTYTWRM
jgi:hypothetical protein